MVQPKCVLCRTFRIFPPGWRGASDLNATVRAVGGSVNSEMNIPIRVDTAIRRPHDVITRSDRAIRYIDDGAEWACEQLNEEIAVPGYLKSR